MTAYVPGEQPDADSEVVKLNTNENPYPPSPHVLAALQAVPAESLRVYPDPAGRNFAAAAAGLLDVPVEWVLPGNGSDNLIVMIARACGGPMVIPSPTFPFYRTQAEVEAIELREAPFGEGFRLPVNELIAAGGAVTFVANPNSPTAAAATNDELDRLAAGLSGLLVIDEAYADFADTNAVEVVRNRANVVLLRTLSKGYSLAGLRLGFAVGRPEILAGLWKTKEIYNVSAAALAAGIAALADQDHMRANVEKIKASRAKLTEALASRGWRVWPSQANFILAAPPDGQAERVYQQLKDSNILVRYFEHPRLTETLRITVGTDKQNEALLKAIGR